MLPRRNRIRKDRILPIIERGVVVRSWAGTLRALPGPATFAVVVSKKLSPKATTRNLLRRRLYGALRAANATSLPFSGVLYPTRDVFDRPFDAVVAAVGDMLADAWSKIRSKNQ